MVPDEHAIIEEGGEWVQTHDFTDVIDHEVKFVQFGMAWRHCSDGVLSTEFYRDIIPECRKFNPYEQSNKAKETVYNRGVGCCFCGMRGVFLSRCSGCDKVRYCSLDCQSKAWSGHRKCCRPPNEFDDEIVIIWDLMGMHFARGEYGVAKQAAYKILHLSVSSKRWERQGQQKRLAIILKPYLSNGRIKQCKMRGRVCVDMDDECY
jgi:hypothetical protein